MPDAAPRWQWVESIARDVCGRYGYREMRTPLLEPTELFKRSIGEVTDVVEKEMYTFEDRGGRSVSLRPENTASCVRAAIQHGLLNSGSNRIWYMGPMFRQERQQAHRYRQFHQLGAELYGVESADADVEIILLSARLWREIGLTGLKLDINSLGTREEQARYRDTLVEYMSSRKAELDEDSLRRLDTNPLRILDSKNPKLQALIESAPAPADCLDGESREHFQTLCTGLTDCGVDFSVNHRLVRGLDYYTRTVFEWSSNDLGAQSAVCGGGRYDRLVAEVGGPDTPGIGFSVGLERLVATTEASGLEVPLSGRSAFLAAVGNGPQNSAHRIAEQIRTELPNLNLTVDATPGSFKAKLRRADRSGARFALILGEDELSAGNIAVKDLRAGGQSTCAIDQLGQALAAKD